MSGTTVSQALRDRFESIRQTEIGRLNKKLRGLSDVDRLSLEAITTEIVLAIANVPDQALTDDAPQPALEALVRLFALEIDTRAA
jgi:glutamyl-tRNA reductase